MSRHIGLSRTGGGVRKTIRDISMGRQIQSVALLVETSNAYARGLLNGVIAYAREHRGWSAYLGEQSRGDDPPDWLARWHGDGIIARIENSRIARAVIKSKLPCVDVSAANLVPSLPWVETDDAKIASLAFEHLVERGLRHLAFCGRPQFNWSNWRCEEFRRLAARSGLDCAVMQLKGNRSIAVNGDWMQETSQIGRWIGGLPKPIGIMACYDPVGRQILQACRQIGLAVPDEVAVVGVDDDELLCELSDPRLSSVAPDNYRAGYEAARLLDRLMLGQAVEPRGYRVDPIGVTVRQSSDVVAVEDVNISTALRFIRDHACEGINVSDVLARVPASRSVLESRFKKLLGRSPHDEISRVRLNRAKELLRETDLPVGRIANIAGFDHPEYMSAMFKKKVGTAPSAYRDQNRRS